MVSLSVPARSSCWTTLNQYVDYLRLCQLTLSVIVKYFNASSTCTSSKSSSLDTPSGDLLSLQSKCGAFSLNLTPAVYYDLYGKTRSYTDDRSHQKRSSFTHADEDGFYCLEHQCGG